MKPRLLLGVLLLSLSLLLAGCQSPSSSETVSWEPTVEPFEVDVTSLITKEQVSDIMGTAMGEGMVLDEGQSMVFLSEDSLVRADIVLSKETRENFDAILSVGYSDLMEAPNIGEIAFWSPGNADLLLYQQGYFLTVHTAHPHFNNDRLLTAARAIATIVLEKL